MIGRDLRTLREACGVTMGELAAALVLGIEKWSADEDGVHTDAWSAYVAARAALGRPVRDPSGEGRGRDGR